MTKNKTNILILIVLAIVCFYGFNINLVLGFLMAAMLVIFSIYAIEQFKNSKKQLEIKVITTTNLTFKALIPKKLNRKFKKKFGKKNIIKEDDYNDFLIKNLSTKEAIEIFKESHERIVNTFTKVSTPINENFSGSNQYFHISYYTNTGDLRVIDKIGEALITKDLINSFRDYVKNHIKKGEKVYEEDFLNWCNLKTKEY